MLDLHKLHAFVVVVEERNITHAANRLFIQQPPLTRLLKKLEEELGTQLLIRQPRGIEPTEAGLALFKEAQLLLEHARHITKLVSLILVLQVPQVYIRSFHLYYVRIGKCTLLYKLNLKKQVVKSNWTG